MVNLGNIVNNTRTSQIGGNQNFPISFRFCCSSLESCVEGKLMQLLDLSKLASRVKFNPSKGRGGRDLEKLESVQACQEGGKHSAFCGA